MNADTPHASGHRRSLFIPIVAPQFVNHTAIHPAFVWDGLGTVQQRAQSRHGLVGQGFWEDAEEPLVVGEASGGA
jgi:hypothetical protein